jgi:hypothetical protein
MGGKPSIKGADWARGERTEEALRADGGD